MASSRRSDIGIFLLLHIRDFEQSPALAGGLPRIRATFANADLLADAAQKIENIGRREHIGVPTDNGHGRPLVPHWTNAKIDYAGRVANMLLVGMRLAFDANERRSFVLVVAVSFDEDAELAESHLETD